MRNIEKFDDFCAENIESSKDYVNYIAENLNSVIEYNDFLASCVDNNYNHTKINENNRSYVTSLYKDNMNSCMMDLTDYYGNDSTNQNFDENFKLESKIDDSENKFKVGNKLSNGTIASNKVWIDDTWQDIEKNNIEELQIKKRKY
jgi:hypothetical protein